MKCNFYFSWNAFSFLSKHVNASAPKMSCRLLCWYVPAHWKTECPLGLKLERLSAHAQHMIYCMSWKSRKGRPNWVSRETGTSARWKESKQIGRQMDRCIDVDELEVGVWSSLWLTGPEPSGADWAIHKSSIVLFINQTPPGQVTFPLYTHTRSRTHTSTQTARRHEWAAFLAGSDWRLGWGEDVFLFH